MMEGSSATNRFSVAARASLVLSHLRAGEDLPAVTCKIGTCMSGSISSAARSWTTPQRIAAAASREIGEPSALSASMRLPASRCPIEHPYRLSTQATVTAGPDCDNGPRAVRGGAIPSAGPTPQKAAGPTVLSLRLVNAQEFRNSAQIRVRMTPAATAQADAAAPTQRSWVIVGRRSRDLRPPLRNEGLIERPRTQVSRT